MLTEREASSPLLVGDGLSEGASSNGHSIVDIFKHADVPMPSTLLR
jgi:hypothetical protein